MEQSFRNILVPVDFSANTDAAVAMALDIIAKQQASLYLLHVKKGTFRSSNAIYRQDDARRLLAWKEVLQEVMPSLEVQCGIDVSQSVEHSIRHKAIEMEADLIVVGKGSRRSWLRLGERVNTSKLARKVGKPVLAVQARAMRQPIKTVVVPLTETSPAGKMEVLSRLCGRMRPVVHLVAFSGNGSRSPASPSTRLQIFKWVQEVLRCPVAYTLLEGGKPAAQLQTYAAEARADMLLLYPEGKTKTGWWKDLLEDVLSLPPDMEITTLFIPTNQ